MGTENLIKSCIFIQSIKERELVPLFNEHETIGAMTYPKMNQNVHVSIIPFAGHAVHLDQPEIYNKIVEAFFNKVESPR